MLRITVAEVILLVWRTGVEGRLANAKRLGNWCGSPIVFTLSCRTGSESHQWLLAAEKPTFFLAPLFEFEYSVPPRDFSRRKL